MDHLNKAFNSLYYWDSQTLSRVQYFSYSLLGSIVTLALLTVINPILDLEGQGWVYLAVFMLLLAIVHNVYIAINLVRKRLKDMGWESVHLWWIFGLWIVTSIHSWGEPESTVTYCLLALDIVVSLWLLFSPSEQK